ncbi:1,2-phenylacetyl-CoA epoxidase subunit PaaC [Bacillus sp. DTU_2020_1000418_1_SI_GHA_SEK_038]|uniref:1,2-phenylacetyl-CoA epoxidase subunit PaaC n=1 Tax=Bacillus sp. DTU_2020_1000418_1_SI_GHA_SEK_038 TaxID=3077585 RepID=UPI0028F16C7E|nr:1,2-phenylacetyl-CoA epoxidase subunit PaaC [Bacillus sp. DTU_2020_1000418_1_SI_GHA_SEK_038]WNS77299.1 1,2-phenylacetyl-CoA epoxidase subunit PaaC [Bacillus sp. DTU_2020_1000418_1_SI_GHA_SEK_038]
MNKTDLSPLNPAYKSSLTALLYQLADDDFIIAYRGSEWLGLAPHIEEDVAFSSISQDTMGHAAMFYQLLEELGEGSIDELAHSRKAKDRRNAVLLEMVNGPGNYLSKPQYDFAFAVVRNYFYVQAKKIRMDSLKNSSYQPLAHMAINVNMELFYHLLHWKTWFVQLMNARGEARKRMEAAVAKVFSDFEGVLTLGPLGSDMAKFGLIEDEELLKQKWRSAMLPVFEAINLALPESFGMKSGNGRIGEHTKELDIALAILSEVYHADPAANW